MGQVHVIDHPLVQHKLTLMRQKDCGTKDSASYWKKSPC